MPYPGVPANLTKKMEDCVKKVISQGKEKSNAIAICHASIMGKSKLEKLHERVMLREAANEFDRDASGKISDKTLSDYGKKMLRQIQGAQLHFTDTTLTVKGNKLVDEKGKVIEVIDNDRMVNKIIYKIM